MPASAAAQQTSPAFAEASSSSRCWPSAESLSDSSARDASPSDASRAISVR